MWFLLRSTCSFMYVLLNEGEVGIGGELVDFALQLEMRSIQLSKNNATL